MKLQISIDLANQIIGYLCARPYQEVYQLIDGIKEAAKSLPLQEVPNGREMDSKSNQETRSAA